MGDAAVNQSEKVVRILSPEDLQQFLQRRSAVEQARLSVQMLVVGYDTWANELKGRYGITGPFSVDTRTGQIFVPEEVPEVAPEEDV